MLCSLTPALDRVAVWTGMSRTVPSYTYCFCININRTPFSKKYPNYAKNNMVTLCKVNHFHYFLQGFLYAVSSKSEFIYSYFPLFLSSTLLFSLTTRAFPITQHRNAPHNIEMLLIFFFPFSILFFPFLPPCLPSFRPDAWHPLCG